MTKLGRWKHFKGNEYRLLAKAADSGDLSSVLIYREMHGKRKLWVRKEIEWNSPASVDGKAVERFDFLDDSNDETVVKLFENDKLRVERVFSNGHASPADFWYDQDEDEYVLLENGSAVLQFADGEQHLLADDSVFLKAHKKHRIKSASVDAVWLCVFLKNF